MSVLVELPEEVERRVREEAAHAGVGAAQFIQDAVLERLARHPFSSSPGAHLSARESELLGEINRGLAPEKWERFHALMARRQAERLTSVEHVELTALTDEVERMNARRMDRLATLACLRGIALPVLMDELGIHSPPYA